MKVTKPMGAEHLDFVSLGLRVVAVNIGIRDPDSRRFTRAGWIRPGFAQPASCFCLRLTFSFPCNPAPAVVSLPHEAEDSGETLLIKKTARNQVTIPRELLGRLPSSDYFEADVAGDALVLRPVQVVEMVDLDKVRDRLRRRRVRVDEAEQAAGWARKNK